MTHTYQITGMTCGSCAAKVKSELLKIDAVTGADVGLAAPQATLTMERHIPLSTLQAAVARAGNYTITAPDGQPPGAAPEAAEAPVSYYPILLIFGFIAGVSALAQWGGGAFSGLLWMRHFMAGFFLVFSFFKLLNLRAFAEGYRTYDVVARRVPAYGFVYPFLELSLGLAYLADVQPAATNMAALLLMAVSTIGVAASLLRSKAIQCACLGTIIKLPLSKVTLFEDVLMVAMSAAMLILMNR